MRTQSYFILFLAIVSLHTTPIKADLNELLPPALQNKPCMMEFPEISAADFIEKIELLKPLYTKYEADIPINYQQLANICTGMVLTYEEFFEQYQKYPTLELEERLDTLGTTLRKIKQCFTDLFEIQSITPLRVTVEEATNLLEDSSEEEENSEENPKINPTPVIQQTAPDPQQQLIQAQQQQLINNLVNSVEQSESYFAEMESRERWRRIRIGAYIVVGIVVVVGIIGLAVYIYRKGSQILIDPFNKDIEKGLEKAGKQGERLLEQVQSLDRRIEAVSENNKVIKGHVREARKALRTANKALQRERQHQEERMSDLKKFAQVALELKGIQEELTNLKKDDQAYSRLYQKFVRQTRTIQQQTAQNRELSTEVQRLQRTLRNITKELSRLQAQDIAIVQMIPGRREDQRSQDEARAVIDGATRRRKKRRK